MNATAALDQAEAAQAHARDVLDALGADLDAADLPRPLGAITGAWVRTLERRRQDGKTRRCSHARGAQPLLWLPWAPSLIRCLRCAGEALDRIRGTVNEDRCDHCQRISIDGQVVPLLVMHPAGVLTDPVRAYGPLIIVGAVCPTCRPLEAGPVA